MRLKSLPSASVKLLKALAAIAAVQQLRQPDKMRGHSSIRLQSGLQPFADLGADGAGMDVVDFNAVLVFAGHDKPFAAIALPHQVPKGGLVHL